MYKMNTLREEDSNKDGGRKRSAVDEPENDDVDVVELNGREGRVRLKARRGPWRGETELKVQYTNIFVTYLFARNVTLF